MLKKKKESDNDENAHWMDKLYSMETEKSRICNTYFSCCFLVIMRNLLCYLKITKPVYS